MIISNTAAGALGLTKLGANTLILTATNTYTGNTLINAGTLQIGDGGINGTIGSGPISNNAFLAFNLATVSTNSNLITGTGTLIKNGTGTLLLTNVANTFSDGTIINNGTLQFTTNAVFGSASSGVTIGNAVLEYVGDTVNAPTFRNITLTGDATLRGNGSGWSIYSNITDGASSFGITINAGLINLYGSNSYDGVTIITNATVYVRTSFSLGSTNGATIVNPTGTLSVETTYTTLEQVYLNGGVLRSSAGFNTAWYGDIILSADSTIREKAVGATFTISGVISGNYGLTINSPTEPGTVIFATNNVYTGNTLINSGTLQVGTGTGTGTLGLGNVTNSAILVFNRSDSFTNRNLITGTGSLIKNGTGTLVITNANTYNGNTLINTGTLQLGAGGTAGSVGSTNITNNAYLAFNHSGTWTNNSILTGGGFVIQAAGTTVFTNANTYTGPTLINAGTLQVGTGANLGNGGNVTNNATLLFTRSGTYNINNLIAGTGTNIVIGNGTLTFTGGGFNNKGLLILGNNTGSGNLDLGSSSHQVAMLSVGGTNTINTITIGSGQSLTVTGAFTVGSTSTTPTNAVTILDVNGAGGTLIAGSGAGTMAIGNDGNTSDSQMGTLDLSGLSTFTASYGTINIGVSSSGRSAGTLILAETNTLTANTLTVADSSGNPMSSYLYLGQSNTFNIGTINIGREKCNLSTLAFTNLFTAPFLRIRGQSGADSDRTILNIGDDSAQPNSSTANAGLVDFSGGTVDAKFSTLTIGKGQQQAGNAAFGTLIFSNGTIDATTIILGSTTGTNGSTGAKATGTLTMQGGNLFVGSGGMILGAQTNASVTGTGIFNLNGGIATFGADIISSNGTSTLTLDGGTLNMQSNNIGSATAANAIDTLNFKSGTLMNVAAINGNGGLTKTTANLLTLLGTNTYTGATVINTGTLAVNGWLPGSAVTATNGGVLAGTGTIDQSVLIRNNGGLAPGNGIGDVGTLTVGALTLTNNPRLYFDLSSGNTSDVVVVKGDLNLNGIHTNWFVFNVLNDLSVGTNTLFTYTGSLLGTYGAVTNFVNIGGHTGVTGYLWLDAAGQNVDLIITVPEPSAFLLVGGGLLALLALRRRNKTGTLK